MRILEWKIERCNVTFQPFTYLFVDDVKQNIGFCNEILHDLKYNHIITKMLTKVTVPALDERKELFAIVKSELETTNLTKEEKQKAIELLGEHPWLR